MNHLNKQPVEILYITYDGLRDPLGASQILPYLKFISKTQGGVVILSFEKSNLNATNADQSYLDFTSYPIFWKSLHFTSRFGVLGKIWDLFKMYFWGVILARRYRINIVHARGHLAAQIGLFIKRLFDAKLLFDCRGLWVDERVDKGGWNLDRYSHRLQYQHYKRIERRLLQQADHIVVLTEKAVNEVVKLGGLTAARVSVIPCCADFDHFPLTTASRRALARTLCGIPTEVPVIGYLGSVGRMYMLERFFRLLEMAVEVRKDFHALVITRDVKQLRQVMTSCLPPKIWARVVVQSASRQDVPNIIPAMDVMVSFILPSYARQAASPTKLAECFAEGIPVICNHGVGDIEHQIEHFGAGVIVDPLSDNALRGAVQQFEMLRAMGGKQLRERSRPYLGLEYAEKKYDNVYKALKICHQFSVD
jgi:glycosyltransferase involved in cell wall biosynthesis